MGLWDTAKKAGGMAYDELKKETDMMREFESKSDSELSKIAKDDGFFGASGRERRVAKAVLKKRHG